MDVTRMAARVSPRAIACWLLLFVSCSLAAVRAWAQDPTAHPSFKVKYAIQDAVYLEGGRNAGLKEGMKLVIRRAESPTHPPRVIAELQVSAVAESSTVCDVISGSAEIHRGDLAWLNADSERQLQVASAVTTARRYPQVISFTTGDPLEEELREAVPKPPLPEINRARGRIGLEYGGTRTDAGMSNQTGMLLRADMSRIGGTYWNLSGYWRGRLNLQPGPQDTLMDLMNRTYHLTLTYNNPNSRWVAGFGRMQLPWATSLDTLDGGYVGRRVGKSITTGVFAGSSPDPSSWNYSPDRRMAGAFVNFEKGSFDAVRFTSTAGVAVSTLDWVADRRYLFTENGLFYKQKISVYHSMQADLPRDGSGAGPLSRSYLTVRWQALRRVSFDLSHNYFRDLPTFDPRLAATGLLDKVLFQGLSGGVRVDLPKNVSVYTNLGRSTRTGDASRSLNQLYGVSKANLFGTGIRADVRYAAFDGSFGHGDYYSASLARNLRQNFRAEVQTGFQNFASLMTTQTRAQFVTALVDSSFGAHYFLQGGFTTLHGDAQNYDQWSFTLGYRFDSRGPR
jgi:hypothetical protein